MTKAAWAGRNAREKSFTLITMSTDYEYFWNEKDEIVQVIFKGRIVRKEDCCKFCWEEILRKKKSIIGFLLMW